MLQLTLKFGLLDRLANPFDDYCVKHCGALTPGANVKYF